MTPETNYLDVSCQKCGHIPQGEKHLCDTQPENAQQGETCSKTADNEHVAETSTRDAHITPHKEEVRQKILSLPDDIRLYLAKNAAQQFLDGVEKGKTILTTKAEELLREVEGMRQVFDETEADKGTDPLTVDGYNSALIDIEHLIRTVLLEKK